MERGNKTLESGWKNLFDDQHAEINLEGIEVSDFSRIIENNVGRVAEEDVFEWLEADEGDPGYHIMTESEIADEVLIKESENESEDSEEESIPPKMKLSTVRSHLDDVISFIDDSADSEMQYITRTFAILELIIKKQQSSKIQTKIDSFFKPVSPKPVSSKTNIDDSPQRTYSDISSEDE